jgi:glycosyltransferase involved in cell wall biosynthesis
MSSYTVNEMVIGMDGFPFSKQPGGIGKYLLAILSMLVDAYPQAKILLFSNKPIFLPAELEDRVTRVCATKVYKKLPTTVWLKCFAGRLINQYKLDCYISTGGLLPSGKLSYPTLSVVHDLVFKLYPKSMGRLQYYSHALFLRHDVERATAVICNSMGTANRVTETFGVEPTGVVYPPIHPRYYKREGRDDKTVMEKYGIDSPYFLSVGTLEPRKNLSMTIRVFASLTSRGALGGHKLVLVGAKGWRDKEIVSLCETYNKDILRLGYVPDEDLPSLYKHATAFLFPSLYEGFGIPVREAMMCGCPVLTSDSPELKESSLGLATYINPNDKSQYEEALLSLVVSSRQGPALHEQKIASDFSSIFQVIDSLKDAK